MQKIFMGLGVVFLVIIFLFILHVFVLFNTNKLMPSVEKFIADFYNNYNKQDFSYIYNTMADKELKAGVFYKDFEMALNIMHQRLGNAKECKKNTRQPQYASKKAYFIIQYVTTYEKGSSLDSFMLKKHNKSWLLVTYNIKWRLPHNLQPQ